MNLNDYQEQALATAVYPREAGLIYPALKLAGEAGEVAEKVGKLIRDRGYAPWDDENLGYRIFSDDTVALALELGDVLWYLAACSSEIGISLEDIANANLRKLSSRQERGVIQGNGDER